MFKGPAPVNKGTHFKSSGDCMKTAAPLRALLHCHVDGVLQQRLSQSYYVGVSYVQVNYDHEVSQVGMKNTLWRTPFGYFVVGCYAQ